MHNYFRHFQDLYLTPLLICWHLNLYHLYQQGLPVSVSCTLPLSAAMYLTLAIMILDSLQECYFRHAANSINPFFSSFNPLHQGLVH